MKQWKWEITESENSNRKFRPTPVVTTYFYEPKLCKEVQLERAHKPVIYMKSNKDMDLKPT